MSINCNRNYIIYNLLDSPDQDMLVINLHFAFICACFRGIPQTFKKCQTLGQFFESLYIKLSEDLCILQFINDIGNERKCILILDGDSVESSIVLYWMQFTI